ncbi:hypothetical protein [Nocardia flavorosea]|uniref:hypothetical protein n=1 Tax=Nocardia flavorosea TaxID=53429 RepID=UPI0024551623|nr:hypothetical protein [Nocardia flavorosea]
MSDLRVDPDRLGDGTNSAASVAADIRADFVRIAEWTNAIMSDLGVACGDDSFGRRFSEGTDGFRMMGDLHEESARSMVDSWDEISTGISSAATLLDDVEHLSAETIRNSV